MMDHEWDVTLQGEAVIGFPPNPHRLRIYAPDPLAFALTGQICALSLDNGNGRKFILGAPYMRRARANADLIEKQSEDL